MDDTKINHSGLAVVAIYAINLVIAATGRTITTQLTDVANIATYELNTLSGVLFFRDE